MSAFRQLHKIVWALVEPPIRRFRLWMLKKSSSGQIEGIVICDMSIGSQQSDGGFLKATKEAMTLIQNLDPRRYRRICRHFDYIVNVPLIYGGDFERNGKICNVDYSRYPNTDYPEWSLRQYACLLVHESTHGVLEEKGILYEKEKRLRIEKLCHREEYRFALRFEPGWADANIGPFDPERWRLYWGPWGNRLLVTWNRFWEAIRAYKSSKR